MMIILPIQMAPGPCLLKGWESPGRGYRGYQFWYRCHGRGRGVIDYAYFCGGRGRGSLFDWLQTVKCPFGNVKWYGNVTFVIEGLLFYSLIWRRPHVICQARTARKVSSILNWHGKNMEILSASRPPWTSTLLHILNCFVQSFILMYFFTRELELLQCDIVRLYMYIFLLWQPQYLS